VKIENKMSNVDINKITELYVKEKWTLRKIVEYFKTDHHTIKRFLTKYHIGIDKEKHIRKCKKGYKKKPFTQEHKNNIGKANLGRAGHWKGKKFGRIMLLKNMQAHLKYDVSFDWLNKFNDIGKLKFLNHSISKKRDKKDFTTKTYILFIEKFYDDENFNKLYGKYVLTKDKWIKPSLDHINPKSKGGTLSLDNLQFISWLENRAKFNIGQNEWEKIKANISEYFS